MGTVVVVAVFVLALQPRGRHPLRGDRSARALRLRCAMAESAVFPPTLIEPSRRRPLALGRRPRAVSCATAPRCRASIVLASSRSPAFSAPSSPATRSIGSTPTTCACRRAWRPIRKADQIAPHIERIALARARQGRGDDASTATPCASTLVSTTSRPIDERLLAYFERSDLFGPAQRRRASRTTASASSSRCRSSASISCSAPTPTAATSSPAP